MSIGRSLLPRQTVTFNTIIWVSLNLGQRKYLPSCRNKGFPSSANFESKLLVRAFKLSAEKRSSHILVNLPVTRVTRFTSSNGKTLGLKHLQLPDVASSSGPPDGESIVYRGTEKLPVQQDTVPDGDVAPPVEKRTQHSRSLGRFFLNLIDVIRPN